MRAPDARTGGSTRSGSGGRGGGRPSSGNAGLPCGRSAHVGRVRPQQFMAIMATSTFGSPQVRPRVDGGLVWVLEDSPLEAEMARRAVAANHVVEIFPDSPAML